jgi:hypothetical protein
LKDFFDPNTGELTDQIKVGDENKGIFMITDIFTWPAVSNPVAWYDGTTGVDEITGSFHDIFVHKVVQYTPTLFDVLSSGGQLDLYYDSTADWDGSDLHATDGTLMVSFQFIPGIIPGDALTTVNGSVNALTNPLSGQAFGYLAVIPGSGAWAQYFDGNAIPGVAGAPANADALIQSNFTGPFADPHGVYNITSFDPVRGTIVPEPGTMMLLGVGLILVAGTSRKRLIKKS